MTVAEQTSGSQTTVITTEHILAETGGSPDLPVGKTYVLALDLNALAAGENMEVRIYGKARTGDTARVLHLSVVRGLMAAEPLAHTIPVPTAWYTKFTIKQLNGSARAIPWAVYSL